MKSLGVYVTIKLFSHIMSSCLGVLPCPRPYPMSRYVSMDDLGPRDLKTVSSGVLG